MKRIVSISFAIFLGFGVLVLNSCKRDDSRAPELTLIGENTIRVPLNAAFIDPGVTVADDIDGADIVTSDFSPLNPNTNLEGTYTINYNTTDNGGNSSHVSRTIIVSNEAKNLAGLYTVNDYVYGKNAGSYTYLVTVTASITKNNQLFLANFGGLGGTVTVTATVNGNAIALKPVTQVPLGMPVPGNITGTGTITSGRINAFNYVITYTGGSDQAYSFWSKM